MLELCQTDGGCDDISAPSAAFKALAIRSDAQIVAFFGAFAGLLEDDAAWSGITEANAHDVADARASGRSTGQPALGSSAGDGMKRCTTA
ncbi:hypothetical protein [Nguyenibacter vanlangensis]|uniref:Uncharacterized protein n=1 Tax=Nguyenibacter vanlangensis TaxID=1216886 RepID=A0A7Y7ITL1_9PROT|nr:hypothetical protein [Nguyenibacter vanlangensis]NVN09585.1 hypothetical protein [Nguyenibacter vanlangensis]